MLAREAPIKPLALWVAAKRWRHKGAAFAAGALSILSMAPFFLWPVLWLTLPALLWLIKHAEQATFATWRFAPWQRSRIGRAAETGWWFGFGYHVFGLFWVGEAFLVEADIFAWLLPFAVTLLPGGLALFTAVACAVAVYAAPTPQSWQRVTALAVGFGVTEWLRGHIFSGFPWNILGYALTSEVTMQLASVFGIYGLTVLAVLVFALPAVLFAHRPKLLVASMVCSAVALFVLSVALTFPIHRSYFLDGDCKTSPFCREPLVRIVQPSVPQREKWRPENQRRIFDDHLALSLTNNRGEVDDAKGISLIVWPEAAMPFLPLQEPVALAEIGRMLPEGITLASGALRADPPATPGERRRVYNSLMLFGRGAPSANVIATYDKTHLVPFGEYLPAQTVLEAIGLQQLSRMRGGFTSGPEPRPLLEVPGIGRLAPLICYEAIFPARVVQTQERPRAFLNVTNDGWFGNTTGPRQHLHMARVRAVEEGIPVIRAANNGISAVIDAYGQITQRLPLNLRGTIDARLPPAIAPPLYARLGDTLFLLMVVVLAALLAFDHRRTRP
jgi:apolipoprotein N-acyltransferase